MSGTPDKLRAESLLISPSLGGESEKINQTLYERKLALISRELTSLGMGRYQWYIFFLCGLGYMIDLLWAQAFGLVASRLQQELDISTDDMSHIFSSFSAGLTAGAFCWGVLVDIIGRIWAFNGTVLCASAFGLCLALPSNYSGILVLTAFVGFGVGGNIPIDTTIMMEFLPQDRRYILAALSVFQPVGVVACTGLAYALIPRHSCEEGLPSCRSGGLTVDQACCGKDDNMGWRYLLYALGGITLGVFLLRFVVFRFQESPQYLLYRGKDQKALDALAYVAKFNGKECHTTMQSFEALSVEHFAAGEPEGLTPTGESLDATGKIRTEWNRIRLLFDDSTTTRLTILVWIIYAFDYWGFTIAGSYLPTVLERKSIETGVSLEQTYLSYVYIYPFGIPGVILGALVYKGRQVSMLFSSAMMGVMLFLFATVNSQAKHIVISGFEYFFQSMFNAILYAWTPEVFPTPIRGSACGIASFWGRIFSIISPLIAARLFERSEDAVLYLAGAGVFVCTVAITMLPRKYLKPIDF